MNALQGFILFSSSDRGGIRIEYAKNKMGDISGSSSGGSSSTGGGCSGGGGGGGSSLNSQPLNNHNHNNNNHHHHIHQHHLQLHHHNHNHNHDVANSVCMKIKILHRSAICVEKTLIKINK